MARAGGSLEIVAAAALSLALGAPAGAQQIVTPEPLAPAADAVPERLPEIDGPRPPEPPATIIRDELGRVTVRAVRVPSLRVDGRLEESLYSATPPMSDFVQLEPRAGTPATERTDVWVAFDGDNVYVTVRAWESEPDRMIVNETRRDNLNILQNENFAFVLDTYYDRRNGIVFNVNPLGGRMDGQVTNEADYNGDWNPVWNLAVGRFDGGWTVEAALPFKSLRYVPGPDQVWGFNARRINRWKNETSFLSRVPDGTGLQGLFKVSRAAALVGVEVPTGTRNLEIKPYAIGDVTTETVRPPAGTDLGGNAGVDLKYGVTASLTADATYRTDFAQVEADEEQVNLTRFNLYFPEKREFFLENQGLFQFGGTTGGGDVPIMFYSRRIGLSDLGMIPIEGGGRLTGRAGAFTLGLLDIQTDQAFSGLAPSTNFLAARLKRDVLRKSSIGAIYTRRSESVSVGPGSAETYGADAAFRFYDNLQMNFYWAQTRVDGRAPTERNTSYRLHLNYDGDRYGFVFHRLAIGPEFNPEVGFLFRNDIRKYFSRVRFSPRPASIRSVRKFSWQGMINYFENSVGRLVTREIQGSFGIEFENSDRFEMLYNDNYELLERPFPIAPGVIIPIGGYDFGSVRVGYQLGQQRLVSGTVYGEQGTFYDGQRTALGYQGRIAATPQLSFEPNISLNSVTLPEGSFSTNLLGSRITYTMTPLMFISGLIQYTSIDHTVSANLRFRWEYQPGSELFLVFNESRDTDRLGGLPGLQNRSFIVKVNRLFRF